MRDLRRLRTHLALRLSAGALVTLCMCIDSAPAQADPPPLSNAVSPSPPPPTSLADTLTGQAKADYDAAALLFRNDDWAGALIKFQSAYATSKDPRLLWNEAACEKNLHHYARVAALLKHYLKEAPALSDQDRADTQTLLQTIVPFVSPVTIVVDQPDAVVTVDGQAAGKAPLSEPVVLDVGSHKVRVTKDGFVDAERVVAVEGGHPLSVDVAMKKVVHEGRLVVNAPESAMIVVDGARPSTGTWRGTLASGPHHIHVTAKNMLPYDREVIVEDNAVETADVALVAEPHKGVPAWVWAVGGVAVAGGLGVGGYFLFRSTAPSVVGSMTPGTVQLSSRSF